MPYSVTVPDNIRRRPDAVSADIAGQNYDRAMTRLSYISTLLQGELPEGDNIIITEEEVLDFEPITETE